MGIVSGLELTPLDKGLIIASDEIYLLAMEALLSINYHELCCKEIDLGLGHFNIFIGDVIDAIVHVVDFINISLVGSGNERVIFNKR